MSAKTILKAATGRLKSLLRGGVSHYFAGRMAMGSAPAATQILSQKPLAVKAEPQSLTMREIHAEHDAILDRFEETARLGHVPADGLIGQLHANHCAELTETKRQLCDVEAALEGCLRSLDARFPVPLPPEPDKPRPPRRRHYRPLFETWTTPPRPRPSSTAQ